MRFRTFMVGLAIGFTFSLPFASANETPQGTDIQILHTNDLHGHLEAGDDNGRTMGMAEVIAVFRTERQQNPDTLTLDAGDMIEGMPIVNINKGENMAAIANEAGYDAMTPGNHEFDYGAQQLEYISWLLNFPVISANVYDKKAQQYVYPPYKLFRVHGVRIGVFGLTTPDTPNATGPSSVKDLTFQDPIAEAKQMVQFLRRNNDVVIAVMHMGVDRSSSVTSTDIADKVPGIDIIIDGHSHTELPHGLIENGVLIAQTGAHGHNVGVVNFVVKDHKIVSKRARLINRQEALQLTPPDPQIDKQIQAMEKKDKAFFNEVLAHSDRQLSGERDLVRKQEIELGDLAADAFRVEAGADIGVVNGGNIRTDLPKGNVTKRDAIAIFPFNNVLTKQRLTGAQVKAMLEHSVASYPSNFGGFLQVSGVTFTYNPTLPAGQRVTEILVDGKPLQEKATYTVATNDFLADGGDGYQVLKQAPVIGKEGMLVDAFSHYLNTHGTKTTMGRIHMQEVPAQKAA